jgi:hypothetical protein
MQKENPPPQRHENPQQGADGKPQTETKVKFYKEDKKTLNCALLFNIEFTLCILLYRIGFGGNKLFVFVFVSVYLTWVLDRAACRPGFIMGRRGRNLKYENGVGTQSA